MNLTGDERGGGSGLEDGQLEKQGEFTLNSIIRQTINKGITSC